MSPRRTHSSSLEEKRCFFQVLLHLQKHTFLTETPSIRLSIPAPAVNEHVNTSLKPSTKTTRLPPNRTSQLPSLEAPRPRSGPQSPQAARPPLLSSQASRAARAGEPPAHEGCRAAQGRPAAAFRLRSQGSVHVRPPVLSWTRSHVDAALAPGPVHTSRPSCVSPRTHAHTPTTAFLCQRPGPTASGLK